MDFQTRLPSLVMGKAYMYTGKLQKIFGGSGSSSLARLNANLGMLTTLIPLLLLLDQNVVVAG